MKTSPLGPIQSGSLVVLTSLWSAERGYSGPACKTFSRRGSVIHSKSPERRKPYAITLANVNYLNFQSSQPAEYEKKPYLVNSRQIWIPQMPYLVNSRQTRTRQLSERKSKNFKCDVIGSPTPIKKRFASAKTFMPFLTAIVASA